MVLQAALAADVMEVSVNSLAKADRLEVEEIPDKKTIRSIAIVPQTAASISEKATKIVGRDWQDGFAKVKMRNHHHYVSRKRSRRG